MTIIEVFDPAMCCSSGVCGPSVDPALSRFAADLDWLAGQDVTVTRYNLAQQPGAFAAQPLVTAALETDGEAALPLVLADGQPVSQGRYPAREELAAWAGLAPKAGAGFVDGEQADELRAEAAPGETESTGEAGSAGGGCCPPAGAPAGTAVSLGRAPRAATGKCC